jgi:hypothetical protein
MYLVIFFVQQTTRLRIAQRELEMRRIAYCEDNQSLISQINQTLLAPYSWLDGNLPSSASSVAPFSQEEGEQQQAALMRKISLTFVRDNPIFHPSSLLPQPSSASSLSSPLPPSPPTNSKSSSRQLSFHPFFIPSSSSASVSSGDPLSFSEEKPTFGNFSHWAEGLFRSLDLPQSSFQSPQGIDLVSSRHLLVASLPSSDEKCSLASATGEQDEAQEQLEERAAMHSQLEEWIQRIEMSEIENLTPGGCLFGDIQKGSRVNLNKYRQGQIPAAEGSDEMVIPPLLQILSERYDPPPL